MKTEIHKTWFTLKIGKFRRAGDINDLEGIKLSEDYHLSCTNLEKEPIFTFTTGQNKIKKQ